MKTDFYRMHQIIHNEEVRELIAAVKRFGGEVHFGCDYTGEDGSGTERPVVTVNIGGEGPQDVYVNAAKVGDGDSLTLLAEEKEWGETFELDTDNIEFGHLSFITDLIPEN